MKNKDLTLVILAAGMGSRFGGLKQIEPVGPNGEFIIDYSVYDAIRAGFNKIVFIIKEENRDIFDETIGKRLKKNIKIEYVYQKLEHLPDGYFKPLDRVKPWGTAQAILEAKDVVKEPFAIINADDFYGLDAFYKISDFLKNEDTDYCVIGYRAKNTLTENGSVKRGICEVKDNYLEKIIESKVIEENGVIIASPLDESASFKVSSLALVSMNMIGFQPNIFNYIEKNFAKFLDENQNKILECEYLIPDVLTKSIKEEYAKAKVIETTSKWIGITHKEDKGKVVNAILEMIENGTYPENLWKE